MATKPKVYPYTILRDDNTYLTYDMTRKEYEELYKALMNARPFIKVEAGIISLKDVRHVIEVEPVEEVEARPENPPVSPEELEQYNKFMKMFDEEDEDQWLN
jgi:hypothetical protein